MREGKGEGGGRDGRRRGEGKRRERKVGRKGERRNGGRGREDRRKNACNTCCIARCGGRRRIRDFI